MDVGRIRCDSTTPSILSILRRGGRITSSAPRSDSTARAVPPLRRRAGARSQGVVGVRWIVLAWVSSHHHVEQLVASERLHEHSRVGLRQVLGAPEPERDVVPRLRVVERLGEDDAAAAVARDHGDRRSAAIARLATAEPRVLGAVWPGPASIVARGQAYMRTGARHALRMSSTITSSRGARPRSLRRRSSSSSSSPRRRAWPRRRRPRSRRSRLAA